MPNTPSGECLLVYLFAMFSIHAQALHTTMPSAWFGDSDAEQSRTPYGNPDVDSEWEDSQPPAVYHHGLSAYEALRAVSLTFCPSDSLRIKAVVVAVESSVELPSAGIAPGSAADGSQESAGNAGHTMLLRAGV